MTGGRDEFVSRLGPSLSVVHDIQDTAIVRPSAVMHVRQALEEQRERAWVVSPLRLDLADSCRVLIYN